MIDTMMALWNQGSQNKRMRICFTILIACAGVFLLLVTVVIPGWLLFAPGASTMTVGGLKNVSTPLAQSGGVVGTPVVYPTLTLLPTNTVVNARATPLSRPEESIRNVRVSEPTPRRGALEQAAAPPATSGPAGEKVLLVPHTVYAGRSTGSVSHLSQADSATDIAP